jgi:trehalose 6-phosphate phosphatase
VTLVSAEVEKAAQLIAPLREHPEVSAVICDIDGTLAPIVRDPGDAGVPPQTRDALRVVARRYALVACVSGRRALEARQLLGLDELAYAGNHGLELLRPGAGEAIVDPAIEGKTDAARSFVLDREPVTGGAGMRLEDKGPIQALHWRAAADQETAERLAREIAAEARNAGLEPHWGRKVLEIRPAVPIDKGTAVHRLLDGCEVELALFAGDDRTDVDAFRALHSLAAAGDLRAAVCIGVASEEAPPELSAEADAMVPGTGGFLAVLGALAPEGEASEARSG